KLTSFHKPMMNRIPIGSFVAGNGSPFRYDVCFGVKNNGNRKKQQIEKKIVRWQALLRRRFQGQGYCANPVKIITEEDKARRLPERFHSPSANLHPNAMI